jgi:2-oxoisovalerate dehydrogenase E1 component
MGDLREQSLIRQGKGWFHISGMGHEALAAVALYLESDDYAFPYYRDRAFCVQRGISDRDLALAFYAKRESSSGGRQLTGHFSDRALNIWSHPSPVGAHLLPACGAAWGMQLDGKKNVVYASLGEASARQGDFFEAVCFAKERKLPVVFVVEDNRIAISTSTTATNPLSLGVLNKDEWRRVDGSDVEAVSVVAKDAIESARAGNGPAFIWCDVERFSNHSSADDQRMYRAAAELEAMHERDPVEVYQRRLISEGVLTEEDAVALADEVREEIRGAYQQAGTMADPLAEECDLHLTGEFSVPASMPKLDLGASCRMLDAVNKTFHSALESMDDIVFFGEDIADPKGGVFNLTKGLSTKDPSRAVNSPLAESTIMGVSVGLASYGKRPCFEIQFVDFIYPGWNQLVSNMATLRWRSFGQWKCPLVIYAPCGGYLPGGALWHSQSGEASFARVPGIRVVVPSTPADAAGLFWTAMHGEDPTIILLPKHLMWAEQAVKNVRPVALGEARMVREGFLLTLVTWGNCLELVEETLAEMDSDLDIELIDLRSIQPWDRDTVADSILKTGRLLVVQEDNISASVGQMIVAEMCGRQDVLQSLKSAPVIVSKADVHVGFNPIYEYAALPDRERVAAALERLLGSTLQSALEPRPELSAAHAQTITAMNASEQPVSTTSSKMITVPILGEGIRVARVVSMLKESGDTVKADDPLCEVETDKAVFPIECDEDGVLGEWLVADGDEVEVGQDLVLLTMAGQSAAAAAAPMPTPPASSASAGAAAIPYEALKRTGGLSQEAVKQLQGIVPATIDMTCRWETVRDARLRSKQTPGGTMSTAIMCGWAVLQAMKKHERFASVVRGNELVYDPDRFDLGMAVALPEDALETAVVKDAGNLEWDTFPDVFNEALRRTRHGAVDSKNRVPLTISSMGAYHVRSAIPIVVPPSLATLFIGAPYLLPDPKSKTGGTMEVASLVLTFDHRWINGVGAASFLSDVRKGIERFDLV